MSARAHVLHVHIAMELEERRICDSIIIINFSVERNGQGQDLGTSTPLKGDSIAPTPVEVKLSVRKSRLAASKKYFAPTVVAAVIIAVWCLFVGFVLIYHLSPDAAEEAIDIGNISTCSSELYTGDVCHNTLQMLQDCYTSSSSEIFIATQSQKQSELENNAALLLRVGLNALNPSQTCESAIKPFLCLYLFPLCDANGIIHRPSTEQCMTVKGEVCTEEWQTTEAVFGSNQLPQCESLPETSIDCQENMTDVMNTESEASRTNNSDSNSVMCRDDFYYDQDDGICNPDCGKWLLYPPALERSMSILITAAMVIGMMGGAVVLLLSCSDYRRVLKFPSIFIIYQTIITMILNITLLVGRVDQESLYCSSRNMKQSFQQPTAYCKVTAVVFLYAYWQLIIWWIAHIASMFWTVWFPFHALRFKTADRTKYIHFTVVLLALVLPGMPAGVHFVADGFVFGRFPPVTCIGANSKVNFYSIVLPAALANAVALSLLVLVFWVVFKESRTTKRKYTMSKNQTQTPEIKILFIVCYFCGVIIFEFAAFSVFYLMGAINSQFFENIAAYFLCESAGIQPGITCDRSKINAGISCQIMFDVGLILFESFPVVNLIYVLKFHKVKRLCKKRHHGSKLLSSSQLRSKDAICTSVTRISNL